MKKTKIHNENNAAIKKHKRDTIKKEETETTKEV